MYWPIVARDYHLPPREYDALTISEVRTLIQLIDNPT